MQACEILTRAPDNRDVGMRNVKNTHDGDDIPKAQDYPNFMQILAGKPSSYNVSYQMRDIRVFP